LTDTEVAKYHTDLDSGPGRQAVVPCSGMATIHGVTDMLALSAHLPEVEFGPGHAVVKEGGSAGPIWVLVSGALRVMKGDVEVNTITQPGAMIGEMSVLLGTDHGATVVVTEPSRLRHAVDGQALLLQDPSVTRLLAVSLAERLNFITSYLADLKHQYGDAPGLAMVSDVLRQLAQRDGTTAQPGSQRDPDPEY
jgi:CRP/FNR family transcriptional regulator, cyclic AMP receptor protein